MRTLLFALLLTSLPYLLPAQIDDLLKNPDVSYLATFESEHDFRLSAKRDKSKIQLLKYQQKDECLDFATDNWLARWVLEEMTTGKYKAYDDPELIIWVAHTTLLNRLSSIDTVITFDPKNYEERVQVIRNDINPDDIKALRTHQAIYFDKKSGTYQTRLLALAPLVTITDPTGKVVDTTPLAWLAMDGKLPSGFSAQSSDVPWSVLLLDRDKPLKISNLKIKKNEWGKAFAEQFFQNVKTTKLPVESAREGYGCGRLLSKKDIEAEYTAIDTIITFDPVTYVETMQVIKNDFKPADLKRLLLTQEWYFDDRRKTLCNRLKAISPLQDRYDEAGKSLLYTYPLYYLRF